MYDLLPQIKARFFDDDGAPLAFGKIWSYAAGTTTLLATYSLADGSAPNTNPVILDASGEAAIYLAPYAYKIKVTDANDVVLNVVDQIHGPLTAAADAAAAATFADIASAAAAAAASSASSASDNRAAAELAATRAVAAGSAAEAAARQAQESAGATVFYTTRALLYADLAHIAGVVAGVYSDPTAAYNGLYQKQGASGAGSWAQIEATIAQQALALAEGTALIISEFVTGPGYSHVFIDKYGNMSQRTTAEGVTEMAVLKLIGADGSGVELSGGSNASIMVGDGLEISVPEIPGVSLAHIDSENNVSFMTESDGSNEATDLSGSTVVSSDDEASLGNFSHDINMVLSYGQSLSIGVLSTPPLTTTQVYDALMFNGGVRPTDPGPANPTTVDPNLYTSLVPLIEGQIASPVAGETPIGGACQMIAQLANDENGMVSDGSYQMLGVAPGEGSKRVSYLNKGTVYYDRIIAAATYGLARALDLNRTFRVQAMFWTQGEKDSEIGTSSATYQTLLAGLRDDFNADVTAITGDTYEIPMITYQLVSHMADDVVYPHIALALLELHKNDPNFYLATPMYPFTYASGDDNQHLTNLSSKKLGAYYGLVYKRVVVDGLEWEPLRPLSTVRQGKVVEIKFNVPRGPLTLDTTLVTNPGDYGFTLRTAADAEITIASVTVVAPDRVRIVADTAVDAGSKVGYALYGAAPFNAANMPRGNLRDSQGVDVVFDPDALAIPLHNWCVLFEETLS